MDAGRIERLEANVERAASAIFAGAIGYAVYAWFGGLIAQPELLDCAGGAAVLAYLLSMHVLKLATRQAPSLGLSVFDVREIETFDGLDELILTDSDRVLDELLLTDADRFEGELLLTDADRIQPDSGNPGTLVLDDILHEFGPDSRVVRLFDRKSMPTPGQLKSKIDDHLENARPRPQSDAAQALSEALAELRRSLR